MAAAPNGTVFVAVPMIDGMVWWNWVNSFFQTMGLLLNNGWTAQMQGMTGNAIIGLARSMLVGEFIDSPCNQMLFIDADLSWDPAGALRLVQSECDVIAGVYPAKLEGAPTFQTRNLRNGHAYLYETDGVPAGFLKISRRAILKMMQMYPELAYTYKNKKFYNLFGEMISPEGEYLGEDYSFCERWARIGGKVYIDPDISFEHYGRKAFSGNFANDRVRH